VVVLEDDVVVVGQLQEAGSRPMGVLHQQDLGGAERHPSLGKTTTIYSIYILLLIFLFKFHLKIIFFVLQNVLLPYPFYTSNDMKVTLHLYFFLLIYFKNVLSTEPTRCHPPGSARSGPPGSP